MADLTPRRRLLQAFVTNLQAITKAAGYRTNIGAVVTLEPGQLDPDQVDDGLAVYIEKQERANDPAVLRTHRLTTVALVVKRKTVDTAEASLDDVLDDIERALLNRQPTWPTGFGQPQFQSMEPLRAPAGADWVGAILRYTSHIPTVTR
ncbi:hypothetical protein H7691_06730 [Stenotrophomonas sp. CW117]|uniref:hypothetical protein n=1 Tax=Stenotrophomonas TaxID=40323 RepID=UPI001783323A|nr:hypothetical protein [Stenotrophomonas sp. CW117]QOF99801.1 hypothetical protein H7691_06730 [Stenotrophomonas sp. CW117]